MFDSAKLKIERANHHIADLERQLIAFTRANLDASIINRDDGTHSITLTILSPPSEIALTIGDAIHNLRTSLDHVMWEMAHLSGGKQHNQLYFPTGGDRQSYEGTCNGMETTTAVKEFFKSFETFPGGKGESNYIVHYLDRADKHRMLTPVIHAPEISELVVIMENGKVRRPLSDLYGTTGTLNSGETLTVIDAPSDWKFAFKNNAEISPHILFGDVEFVEGKPILPTLGQLRDAVVHTIDIIERALR